jgi:uncharacterized protein YndB with AHSA1/START domain
VIGGARSDKVISVTRTIQASPASIFEVLANPERHVEIDGSGTVQQLRGEGKRLQLGSTFGMSMKLGFVPYRIENTVVEFEENRLIAWRHYGGHRWRYELAPVESAHGATSVTESFDWNYSHFKTIIKAAGYPKRHRKNIEQTLERLASVVESRGALQS